jgi:hypothetical protein
MPEEEIAIKGLDLTTSGHQTPGACRLLENLVPTGRPDSDRRLWEVPQVEAERGDFSGLLSIGWQRRSRLGDLADTAGDPGQSLNRLVALKADGVYVIDPGQSYAEKQLWSFSSSDDSRRATFAQVGPSLFVAVTKGDGVGAPEVLLEVKGDVATPVQWPPLPIMDTSYEAGGPGLRRGTILFRVAWELEDGTIGPAGPPFLERRLDPDWSARVRVERQPPIPGAWKNRLRQLVLLAHVPTFEAIENSQQTRQPRTKARAVEAPPRIIGRFKSYEPGNSFQIEKTFAEIQADEQYDGVGLRAHEVEAGALYSYNQRLILGDTTYQLHRPHLEQMLQWAGGTQNAGGDDYWLVLEVTVETQLGDVTVHSDPLPFDSSAITQVETRGSISVPVVRQGYLYYPDTRAKSWRFLVSTDYAGDFEAATWEEATTPGSDRTFTEAAGGGFVYTDIAPGEPYDMTNRSGAPDVDPLAHRLFERSNDDDKVFDPQDDFRFNNGVQTQTSDPATIEDETARSFDFAKLDPTGSGAPQAVSFDYKLDSDVGPNNDADASYDHSIEVKILDESGNVLDSFFESDSGGSSNTVTGSQTVNNFSRADADTLQISFESSVTTSPTASFSGVGSFLRVHNMSVDLDVTTLTGDERLTRGAEDSNPNRLIWSQPNTPLDLSVENVLFAGEAPTDRILAMRATGQPVSSGQFGQYPIVLLGRESARMLQVGSGPFIERVDVLTASMGAVGRRAATVADGQVVAALDGGVYVFSPQLQRPALSAPLHDPSEKVLTSLGPDTSVAHYKDPDDGRDDLWLTGPQVAFNYDLDRGGWSTLAQFRVDYALRPDASYGVTAAGALAHERQQDGVLDVRIQTAVIPAGPIGLLKRAREAQLRQPRALDDVAFTLVATDPTRQFVTLGRSQLQSGSVEAGLQLKTGLAPGYVIDVDGVGTSGQSVESLYLEWDLRDRRLRDHEGVAPPDYLGAPILVLTAENDV